MKSFVFPAIAMLMLLACVAERSSAYPTTVPFFDEATAAITGHHVSQIQEDADFWDTGLIVGDSITQMLNRSAPGEVLRSKGIFVSGIGGNRVEQGLWRIENGLLDEEEYCPKRVLLALGTNNLMNRNNTPAQIVDGIDNLANKCLDICPDTKVHVLSVLPRSWAHNVLAPIMDKLVLEVNQGLLNRFRFRNSRGIEFHDVTNVFQLYNQTLARVHTDPTLYEFDGVHLGIVGQTKLLPFLLGIFKV